MKKLFCLTLISLLPSITNCFSQNIFPANGKVGIGTNLPDESLQIHGRLLLSNNGTLGFLNSDPAKKIQLGLNEEGSCMQLDGGSLVAKNDLIQDLGTGQWWFRNGWFGTRANLLLSAFVNVNDYNGLIVGQNNSDAIGLIKYPEHAAGLWRPQQQSFAIGTTDSEILSPSTFLTHMIVSDNGNIGINTISPSEKLSVNGFVLAKRFKQTMTATDWSDDVFENNYQLPSIKSLRRHLKEHKCLIGLPSSKHKIEDGLNVGSDLSALLRKIEELTLYIIQQHKDLEELVQNAAEEQKLLQEKISGANLLINTLSN